MIVYLGRLKTQASARTVTLFWPGRSGRSCVTFYPEKIQKLRRRTFAGMGKSRVDRDSFRQLARHHQWHLLSSR